MAGPTRADDPQPDVAAAALPLAAQSDADGVGGRLRPRRRAGGEPASHPTRELRPGHRRGGNPWPAVARPHRWHRRRLPVHRQLVCATSVTLVTARLPGIGRLIAYSAHT